MEIFRSKSYKKVSAEWENTATDDYSNEPRLHKTGTNPCRVVQDLRCYSASSSSHDVVQTDFAATHSPGLGGGDPWKLRKVSKSTNGAGSKTWAFGDPEMQRRKRIASYKAYTVEGNLKRSIKSSMRWIKETYTHVFSCRK